MRTGDRSFMIVSTAVKLWIRPRATIVVRRLPLMRSVLWLGTGMGAAMLRSEAVYAPMRLFSFFLAFFAAFFSFAVIAGCFLFSLLLFCSLPMTFAPA
jgi:hypothetical protein